MISEVTCVRCHEVLTFPEPDDEEFPAWVEVEDEDEALYLCWRCADDAQV
jgi:hypothetical protein